MQTLKLTKKYERYSEYKDSGVEWLGKIPTSWSVQKIASIFDFSNQKVTEDTHEPLSVTYDGIKKQVENAAKVAEGSLRKLVEVGDIVINGRSDRKGAVGMSEYEGGVSLVYNVLRKRDKTLDSKYFHYLFRSNLFSEEFYRWGRGIVDDLWTTREGEMKRIYVPLPSSQEQTKIAKYLDEKTSSIDQIIKKKQKLIELLREKRTSVINQAVTKGLNPKVELVDSGVEWIGKMPKEWKLRRLKDISLYCSRGGTPEYTENDDDYKFINQSCIRDGFLDLEKIKFSSIESKKGLIKDGDILINSTGTGTLGRLAVFNENEKYFADTHVTIYRPKENIHSRFLMYLIQHPAWQNYLYASCVTGSTNQIELSRNKFLEIPVLIPGLNEQIEVATCLDKKTSLINQSIKEIERSIELLQEFKSSLISNIVTGKIKV